MTPVDLPVVRPAPDWMLRGIAALAALLTLLLAAPVLAQPKFPPLTGRVVDQANLLTPAQEQAIEARLAALETQSQRQLVVATLPDLQGYDIADYGYQLGRAWGLGDRERNDGALLIVAPNQRKVRIEVGYGLEPVLTDALSALIVQETILPRFREGDFAGGIAGGVERLVTQLQLPEDQARQVAQAAQARQSARDQGPGFGGSSLVFLIFILFFFVLPLLRSVMGGSRRMRRSGLGSIIMWSALSGMSGGRGGGFGGGGFGGGGFSGGGGSFGGGGASGGW